jgi:hypothetical protein
MESKFNNTRQILQSDSTWYGLNEVTTGFTNIAFNIITTENVTLTISQSIDGIIFDFVDEYVHFTNISGNESTTQFAVKAQFFKCSVHNDSMVDINNFVITTLFLDTSRDSSLQQPAIIAGSVTVLNGIKATDYEFNTLRDVACNNIGNLLVNVNNDVTVKGINNNFEFFPTATNNTATVYADGTKGTDVAGGWQYANTLSGKINWYCYASPSLETDYKVSQLNSMYAVVNNQSTLGLAQAQNPWIMIYTRMDSGTNSGGFYKSKLFFGSNAHTDINGLKLLYTGEDPTHIHPEITGINRIQLLFNSALSNGKQLVDVQNESILAGSLQTTNNTSPANSFFFTMQEFGCDWVKESVILPIEFNKVKCDVSGSVAVATQPALTFSTDKVDVSGSSVTVTELSTSVVSLSTITNTHQDIKNAPGTLKSILITYNNAIINVIAYVKIYDDLTPIGSSTPKIVLPIVSGTTIQFDCHNLVFNTGITIRNVDSFGNGSTPPSGTLYATVLYN